MCGYFAEYFNIQYSGLMFHTSNTGLFHAFSLVHLFFYCLRFLSQISRPLQFPASFFLPSCPPSLVSCLSTGSTQHTHIHVRLLWIQMSIEYMHFVYVYGCIRMRSTVCMHACIYVCVCLCVFVCVYAYLNVNINSGSTSKTSDMTTRIYLV